MPFALDFQTHYGKSSLLSSLYSTTIRMIRWRNNSKVHGVALPLMSGSLSALNRTIGKGMAIGLKLTFRGDGCFCTEWLWYIVFAAQCSIEWIVQLWHFSSHEESERWSKWVTFQKSKVSKHLFQLIAELLVWSSVSTLPVVTAHHTSWYSFCHLFESLPLTKVELNTWICLASTNYSFSFIMVAFERSVSFCDSQSLIEHWRSRFCAFYLALWIQCLWFGAFGFSALDSALWNQRLWFSSHSL